VVFYDAMKGGPLHLINALQSIRKTRPVRTFVFWLLFAMLPACTPVINDMSQDKENQVHAAIATSLSRFSHQKPVNCNSQDLYEALGVTRRLAYGFTEFGYKLWAGELMMDVANTGLKQGCLDFAEGLYGEVMTTFVGAGYEELRQQALGRIGDVRAARMKLAN
jgi:hypothetical protein